MRSRVSGLGLLQPLTSARIAEVRMPTISANRFVLIARFFSLDASAAESKSSSLIPPFSPVKVGVGKKDSILNSIYSQHCTEYG